METKTNAQPKAKKGKIGFSSTLIIIGCLIISFALYIFVFGDPSNFDEAGRPIQGNIFGTLHEGGYVIPIVMTLMLTVIGLSIERIFALNTIKGTGKLTDFVAKVKHEIDQENLVGAKQLCDKQKGSIANILNAAILRYEDIESQNISNDEKAELIAQEVENATTLEMPAMERNLNIIAAISTLGTLMGLFGTVLGMIKSFGAMGHEGAPDATALAVGISEALLNTAMGIGTGALAIIAYTYFAGRVQNMTNAIDEVGFAIGQTFTKRSLRSRK